MKDSGSTVRLMEKDIDLEEALVGLGYSRAMAKDALSRIDSSAKTLEERLKEALKILKQ